MIYIYIYCCKASNLLIGDDGHSQPRGLCQRPGIYRLRTKLKVSYQNAQSIRSATS